MALLGHISSPDSPEIAVAHVQQQSFGVTRNRKSTIATVIADISQSMSQSTPERQLEQACGQPHEGCFALYPQESRQDGITILREARSTCYPDDQRAHWHRRSTLNGRGGGAGGRPTTEAGVTTTMRRYGCRLNYCRLGLRRNVWHASLEIS